MNGKVRDAIDEQINKEFYAAYLYLAMAEHFEAESLEGFAHWMRLQAREELGHAMRLFEYMVERRERVELKPIAGPAASFGSAVDVMEKALEHERAVTESINGIYRLAAEQGDYATQVHLQWFLTEQVEEENSAETLVERLRMAGDNRAALLILDREVAQRATAE